MINDTYRTLFIHRYGEDNDSESQQHTDCFVIDDFKMYFLTKVAEKMGLKISQHTRKNKQGPVMHQIVRSASGLIGGIHFEMTKDTATTSMLSLIKDQLITMLGGNLDTIDGLEGSEFFTDRGYKESVNAIIKAGADINGTDAKTFSCPFVYGQKLRPNDSREEIDVNGGKTLMIKKTSIHDRRVFVHFYRNGNW